MHRMEKKSTPILAPLPKADREKLERKVTYEQSKKDITKWEPLVKRNREAPTLYFDEDIDLGFSTVGAIASEFEPRTEFEKKIAALVNDNEVVEAHKKDGARLLELNKVRVFFVKFGVASADLVIVFLPSIQCETFLQVIDKFRMQESLFDRFGML